MDALFDMPRCDRCNRCARVLDGAVWEARQDGGDWEGRYCALCARRFVEGGYPEVGPVMVRQLPR